ncbi:hypothetical protein [Actinoplanes sp. NPDC051851]|uniref:hypothetical protein n=1 Tax=Actinoplanes sp. NPDC051851 TaxID=3154753 RepID=UPI003423C487
MKRYRSNRNNGQGWDVRRWRVVGIAGVAVAVVGAGLGVASAATTTAVPTVNCPSVADELPAIPARAQDEVERNLALLNTQIQEANNRLASSVGEGGDNFIQNAILGPLKDKRASTIDRIVISIGRGGEKPVLDVDTLATCTLNENGGGEAAPEPTAVESDAATAEPSEEASDEATADPTEEAGDDADDADDAGNTGVNDGTATVNCPDVVIDVDIPASAQDEVTRNLALLETQIDEANARIASTAGQGGANFIQNAILGPLADKRLSTINRIETAIGRTADKPDLNAEGLSVCTLNE